jgi:arylsulfatase A-like enzyme
MILLKLFEQNHSAFKLCRLCVMLATSVLLLASLSANYTLDDRPNIVLIIADDIGYGDLSCYGATKITTPNIDSIAKSGIRFTDAHTASTVCTPSRYSLLSGEYSFRKPGGAGILNGDAPLAFADDQATLPKILRANGYRTGVVGKWHLGLGRGKPNFNTLIKPGPFEVGFDESFIMPSTGDRVPCVFLENGRVANYDPNDPIEISYSNKIGNEPTGKENPELLKLKPVQGHLDTVINGVSRIGFMTGGKAARWVDEDIADTLTAKATQFISNNKDKPFFLYFATQDVHAPILPHQRFVGKSQSGIRGDTIQELDWSVGQVLKALKEANLAKNTIVIVSSDNGAVEVDGYRDVRENTNGHIVNGPLRGTKYTLYEGGHRIPLVVQWPAKSPKGKTSQTLVTQTDLFASIASVLNIPLGPGVAADSQDTSRAFFRADRKGRQQLIHHKGGFGAPLGYREGDYVIVPNGKNFELYNVAKDIGQKNDLASSEPQKLTELIAKLEDAKPKMVR